MSRPPFGTREHSRAYAPAAMAREHRELRAQAIGRMVMAFMA